MDAALPKGARATTHGFSNFKYDPLDLSSKRPSIRLAILQPGIEDSTLKVNLTQSTFADRPKYEALSYTWGSPDAVRGIVLNGTRVAIRENLWSALEHLRDAQQERVLWIDAICINQLDIEERNHQVKLMAHIFERAEEVLIWLGRARQISSFTFSFKNKNLDIEVTPDDVETELVDLCNAPYWNRVWIVQEIGAATKLRVHWASTYSVRRSSYSNFESDSESSQPWEKFVGLVRKSPTNAAMALKLADQREGRHGDSFLLANLIEVCQNSMCEEPRDKIYGFVGIAHDCQDDSLPVDYSKSLFELYEDAIRHQYHWTKENPNMLKENKKTIVHLSQVIQKVLGGSAEMHRDFAIAHPGRTIIFPPSPLEEVTLNFDPFKLPAINSGTVSISSSESQSSDNFDIFKVTGIHSGTVSLVGPSYSDIIGDPEASKIWKSTLSNCNANLAELRKKNEGFMRVLLELNSQDLSRVCSIETEFWWRCELEVLDEADSVSIRAAMKALSRLPRFKLSRDNTTSSDFPPRMEEETSEPRLFLSRAGLMGLMPPNARGGDLIFQFWNSDTAAVVRKEDHYMRIVGRAVVSNPFYMEEQKFHTPLDGLFVKQRHGGSLPIGNQDGFDFGLDGKDVYMDISTLQLLTQ